MAPHPSRVFEGMPTPDWADSVIEVIPPQAPTDPARWANEIFSIRSTPLWVRALLGLRQALVGMIGIRRASGQVFAITGDHHDEAVIDRNEPHLRFVVGVAVDAERHLVTVTTAVKFNQRRGRIYFLPVRLLHDPVTRAMVRSAASRLSQAGPV